MTNQALQSRPARFAAWLAAVLALAVAVIVASNQSAAAADSKSSPGFCEEQPSRYLRPLLKMPPLLAPPASERLPFGPERLRIYIYGGQLQVGAGGIGFAFSNESIEYPFQSDWIAELDLLRVDQTGTVKRRLNHKVDSLFRIAPNGTRFEQFKVSPHPGYYRVNILLRTRGSGDMLGRYGAYFRVVRPTFGVKLAASTKVVAPGQTIYARVKNLGTELVTPDSLFPIERLTGGDWAQVASASVSGLRPTFRARLRGGEDARCASFQVAADVEPGTYRFKADVRSSFHEHTKVVTRFAEFSVGSL
jgi:hypothetical protein